jgi:chaperonin GroES
MEVRRMIKPFQNRVVVARLPEEEVTKSGIYIPDAAQEKPRMGVVVAVSEQSAKHFKQGDVLVFGKYSGIEVKDRDGTELLILKLEDVHGIETEETSTG